MNQPADDIDALAGEYVLGTLSLTARREVEARMSREPALLAAVQAWETRLLPLTALAPPAEPTPSLWTRIEQSIAAAPAAKPRFAIASRWWSSLALWRGLAAAGFATAAILPAVLVTRPGAPAPPQYLVVLVAPDKAPGWVVQTNSSRQLSLVPLGSTTVPENKSLQFWTKGEQWRGPLSLGLVTPGRTLRIELDKLPPLEPNQLFELTLEPANGSPLDRPTGPVLYIGRAVKIL